MDKRNNLNNDDKISILKRLIDTDIDNKIEISFYARDDNEFKTLMEFCRKQDLHEIHKQKDGIYWVYYHDGYNEEDFMSANIQICIFEPR
jgi:23S rRNA C2498 (ribose-2'-O)-methylase RlmM